MRPASVSELPPDVEVVYAVGDVHGCIKQLHALEALIATDAARAPAVPFAVVYLGDLIDRGPHSSEVIQSLMEAAASKVHRYCVCGNHERAFLDFVDHPELGARWLGIGGAETLRSYGITIPFSRLSKRQLKTLAMEAKASIPQEHIDFLRRLPTALTWKDYLFVHAGVRPGISLENQHPKDLLEIREPFLSSSGPFSRIVVHGHSPSRDPLRLTTRISLDTGCYATGRLSAARLEADTVEFLSVGNAYVRPKGAVILQGPHYEGAAASSEG